MGQIILASTSPYRKQLLENINIPFIAVAPKFDEETLKSDNCCPKLLCQTLASKKAESLKEDYPTDFIIGSDQLVSFEGDILGKAGSSEAAVDQLLRLQANQHELITAVAVVHKETVITETIITKLTMRALTRDQATAIVNKDKSWDCAGSYKLEKSGITLFSKISTEDHSAIIGLPLIALTTILIDLGLPFPLFEN